MNFRMSIPHILKSRRHAIPLGIRSFAVIAAKYIASRVPLSGPVRKTVPRVPDTCGCSGTSHDRSRRHLIMVWSTSAIELERRCRPNEPPETPRSQSE